MKDEHPAPEEVVIKEYPYSTRWMGEQQIIGVGNLVLTNERIVFLHRLPLDDAEIEYLQKFSQKATTREMIDLAFTMHKKNFQFPLSSVVLVKTGLHSILPLPRPCLRISYMSGKKKQQVNDLTFMFTIPLLKGIFQWEITTVMGWVNIIKKAVRHRQLTA